MRRLPVRSGGVDLLLKCSDEDAPFLSRYRWHRTGRAPGYVAASVREGRRVVKVYAARLVARLPEGSRARVAYRNGDPLDVRRSNVVVLGERG